MSNIDSIAIAELAEVNPPVDLRGLSDDVFVSFIPMADVTDGGQWVNRKECRLGDIRLGYTPFKEGDILFAKITPCMENGKGAHAVGLKNGVGFGSTEFHVLRALDSNNPRFLFHWLQSPLVRAGALAFMGGSAGQQRVQSDFFSHFRVVYFEGDEQARIAAVLDYVDEAIAKAEAVIAKLRQVRAGLLHDLLTRGLDENGELRDPVSQPEQFHESAVGHIPLAWKIGSLIGRISLPQGQVDPKVLPYREWPLIAPDHIESETGRLIARKTAGEQGAISGKYVFAAGDVVYSKIRPYLRKAVLATEAGLCSADMYPMSPNPRVNPRFLLAVVLGEAFSRFASALSMRSGFPKLNREELAEFVMGWPPSSEQDRIAETLLAFDEDQTALERELWKLKNLKSGLMSDLLTGRVRVPENLELSE